MYVTSFVFKACSGHLKEKKGIIKMSPIFVAFFLINKDNAFRISGIHFIVRYNK